MLREAEGLIGDGRPQAISAIYGTILVTGVLAALSEDQEAGPGELLSVVIDTTVVFWLAHVYAEHVGERAATSDRAKWHSVPDLLVQELPMVASAIGPVLALALGVVHAVTRDTAVALALGAGVVELFVWGFIAGRHERLGIGRGVAGGLANAGLGVLIVFLKVLVH